MSEFLIKKLADLATKQLLSWLVSKVPFFAFGPVNWIAGVFIKWVAVKLLELTHYGLFLAYIRIDAELDASKVRGILKEIESHEGDLTNEQMQEYDKRLASAGRELIRFGTIRP